MAGRRPKSYRAKGEGSVFQRCDHKSCPPTQLVPQPDGTQKKVRPPHNCKGLWIGRIDLGYVDGKKYRPQVSARTKQKVHEKLSELKEKAKATGGKLPKATLTVEQWLNHWIHEISTVGPTTWPTYKGYIDNHLIPGVGHIRLERLDADDLRSLYKRMGEKGNTGARPQVHAIIRKALTDATREIGLIRNVAKLVPEPAGKGGKRSHHDAISAWRILNAALGDRLESRWEFAIKTGKRQGECLGLEWERVQLGDGVADVRWQLQRLKFVHGCGTQNADKTWPCGRKRGGTCTARTLRIPDGYACRVLENGLCLVRPKSERSERPVPIPPLALESLRRRRAAAEKERETYTVDHGLVWCRPDGRPIEPGDDLIAWKELQKRAGVRVLDLHAGGRHTTGTLMLEQGTDRHVVQELLGHGDEETTEGYQHVDLTLTRAAVVGVEDTIQAAGEAAD